LKKEKMEWDKFRMAQKFLQRANAIHPEDAGSADQFNEALALQDVYYDCYMSSFSRADLIRRLGEIAEGKITLPEEEKVDEEKYRAVFAKEAQKILTKIEAGNDL
jgi:hypothetical protein